MTRSRPTKPDRREIGQSKSVKAQTARPKGITPEETEPKHPRVKTILGQSGSHRKKGKK